MYVQDAPTLGAMAVAGATLTSNDFGSWSRMNYGGSSALPVVTPNYATAPDGTQTAARVVLVRGPGNATRNTGNYAILRLDTGKGTLAIPGTVGQVYTDSLYIMRTPGSAACAVDLRATVSQTAETNSVVTPGTSWQRYPVTTPPVVTPAGHSFELTLWDAPFLSQPTTEIADILVWGFRSDLGTTPLGTNYAQSAGAAGSLSPLAWLGIAAAGFALFGGNGRRY